MKIQVKEHFDLKAVGGWGWSVGRMVLVMFTCKGSSNFLTHLPGLYFNFRVYLETGWRTATERMLSVGEVIADQIDFTA